MLGMVQLVSLQTQRGVAICDADTITATIAAPTYMGAPRMAYEELQPKLRELGREPPAEIDHLRTFAKFLQSGHSAGSADTPVQHGTRYAGYAQLFQRRVNCRSP